MSQKQKLEIHFNYEKITLQPLLTFKKHFQVIAINGCEEVENPYFFVRFQCAEYLYDLHSTVALPEYHRVVSVMSEKTGNLVLRSYNEWRPILDLQRRIAKEKPTFKFLP